MATPERETMAAAGGGLREGGTSYLSLGEAEETERQLTFLGYLEQKYVAWSAPLLGRIFSNDATTYGGLEGLGQTAGEDGEHVGTNPLIDPKSLITVALPIYYFCTGFTLQMSQSFITSLFTHLSNFDEFSYDAIEFIIMAGTFPHGFRLVAAVLSDSLPIRGLRRKPYIYLGLLDFVAGAMILSLCSLANYLPAVAIGAFVMETGVCFMYVVAEAMVVERSRLEFSRGVFLLFCTFARFLGGAVGSVMVDYLFPSFVWFQPLINALVIVLLLLPFLPHLKDPIVNVDRTGLKALGTVVLHSFQFKALLLPMAFVIVNGTVQSALFQDFVQWSRFNNGSSGMSIVNYQYVVWALGTALYAKFMYHISWHHVIIACSVGLVVIVLVGHILSSTLYNEIAFPLSYLLDSFERLPVLIMIVGLIPEGVEATVMVLLDYCRNGLTELLGSLLWGLFTFRLADAYNTWWVSIAIATLVLSSLALLRLFPKSVDHQEELRQVDTKRYPWYLAFGASSIALLVVVLSFLIR